MTYFGVDADRYEYGNAGGYETAWRRGVDGAKLGLQIPGRPKLNQGYYREIAPKVAMDRRRIPPSQGFPASRCLHG